jgi:microcystin-dependent protein
MSFGFAPRGWAACDGQLLKIDQNAELFALLGTTYGGDGRDTFGLPNVVGRVPIHRGNGFTQGEVGGEQAHHLSTLELPMHTHIAQGSSSPADEAVPTGNYLGGAAGLYGGVADTTSLSGSTISKAGGGQPHDNMQPYLVLNFCIALQGAYPRPN